MVQTTRRVAGAGEPQGTRIEEPGGQDRTVYDDGTVEYDEPFDREVEVSDGVTRTEHVNTRGEVERTETVRTRPDGSTEVIETTRRVGTGTPDDPVRTRIEEPGGQNRTVYDDGTAEYDRPFDREVEVTGG